MFGRDVIRASEFAQQLGKIAGKEVFMPNNWAEQPKNKCL